LPSSAIKLSDRELNHFVASQFTLSEDDVKGRYTTRGVYILVGVLQFVYAFWRVARAIFTTRHSV